MPNSTIRIVPQNTKYRFVEESDLVDGCEAIIMMPGPDWWKISADQLQNPLQHGDLVRLDDEPVRDGRVFFTVLSDNGHWWHAKPGAEEPHNGPHEFPTNFPLDEVLGLPPNNRRWQFWIPVQ